MLTRVDLTLDCANPEVLAVFWRTAAGYVNEPPPPPFRTRDEWLAQFADEDDDVMGAAWLRDPTGVAPRLCLLQVPEPKTAKNRLHLDLRVSGSGTPEEKWSRVTVEVARLTAAGRGRGLHVHGSPRGHDRPRGQRVLRRMTAGAGSDAAIRDLGGRPGFVNAAPDALRSRLLSNQHGQQMTTGLPGGRPAPRTGWVLDNAVELFGLRVVRPHP